MDPGPDSSVNAQLVQYVIQHNETDITCPDCGESRDQYACDSYSEDHTVKLFCTNCNEQFTRTNMRDVLWKLVEQNEELAQVNMLQQAFKGGGNGSPFDSSQ